MIGLAKSDDRPETIFDDLAAHHAQILEGSSAALAKRDADIAAQQAEIQSLKAMNFETMIRNKVVDDNDDESDTPNPPENTQGGINSLFTFTPRR